MNTEHTCCAGDESLTPEPTANRPGLPTLHYRVGRHGSFLASMRARLSTAAYPALGRLRTRDVRDPAVALLDSWATIADVLTFYQERIANEGFLRTATERRSLTELARLVGYQPRPGLAASTHLAFTIEDSVHGEVEIPRGTRAQSLPGPGELPQPFETTEPLKARAAWSRLPPRLNRPQTIQEDTLLSKLLYLQGLATGLKRHDALLIVLPDGKPDVYRVDSVVPDPAGNRTAVTLAPWSHALSEAFKRELRTVARLRAFVWQTAPQIDDGRDLIGQLIDILKNTSEEIGALSSPERRQVGDTVEETLSELQELIERRVQERGASRRNIDISWGREAKPAVATALTTLQATKMIELSRLKTSRALNGPTINVRQLEPQGKRPKGDTIHDSQLRAAIFDSRYMSVADTVAGAIEEITQRLLEAADDLAIEWPSKRTPQPETRTSLAEARVYALRLRASLFGHNVPKVFDPAKSAYEWKEWTTNDSGAAPTPPESPKTLFLDNAYDAIVPSNEKLPSFVVIQKPFSTDAQATEQEPQIYEIERVAVCNRAAYGISGKSTQIVLKLADPDKWWEPSNDAFATIRGTLVYTQSEPLALALEPDTADVPDQAGPQNCILLDGLYDGLSSGRLLIVSGERADQLGALASELATIATTRIVPASAAPGDVDRTQLLLIEPLRYRYKRSTVTLYANVVGATHGETRKETLGSGDAVRALQREALQQSPLTHLPAPTPSGVESTLELRVNSVRWHPAERMTDLGPADRAFVLRIDDQQKATAIFGDGERGARLPTGQENVRATYRFGLGAVGNVKAGQISQLATRPYGVKAVLNPLAASGGADPESAEQLRQNTSLALMALGRLLSVRDYADFALAYAGIGKASAARFFDGGQQAVYLTIAGTESKPIADRSELYRNLGLALRRFGDPRQSFALLQRELAALVIHAYVRIHPDYLWEQVAGRLRAVLLDTFGYDRRELGQDVTLSELINAIQQVEGVAYADVDLLERVPESLARTPDESLRRFLQEHVAGLKPGARPTQRLRAELARVATSHRVRDASESLVSIAERYRVDLGDLQRLNPSLPPADMPLANGTSVQLVSAFHAEASDTLVSIATQNNCSLDLLLQLNPNLHANTSLKDTVVTLPQGKIYLVVQGESLSSIVFELIKRLNPTLANNTPLTEKDRVELPDGSTYINAKNETLQSIAKQKLNLVDQLRLLNPGLPADLPVAAGAEVKLHQGYLYKVKVDDTLTTVAEVLGIPPALIQALNPALEAAKALPKGTELSIANNAIYQAQANDTLRSIATAHSIANELILRLNPDVVLDATLRVGIEVTIASGKKHTVTPGETLRSIANDQKPSTSDAEILQLNPDVALDVLLAANATIHLLRCNMSATRQDETLLSIAQNQRLPAELIGQLNPGIDIAQPLKQPTNIQLPSTYRYLAQGDQTLTTIARALGVELSELQALNPDLLTMVRLPFTVLPAQLLVLLPEIPETLLLEQLL